MKQTKEKGITLIALIITVIIMLILASVAIYSITNTGLFDKTKAAAELHNNAVKAEEGVLKQLESILAEKLGDSSSGSSSGDIGNTIEEIINGESGDGTYYTKEEIDTLILAILTGGTIGIDKMYPVGSIYMSTSSTNPGSIIGGTWTAWGAGRVPVGVATSGTFNSVEKTGGAENTTLATTNLPSHNHSITGTTTSSAGEHTHDVAAFGTDALSPSDNTALVPRSGTVKTSSAGAHTHTLSATIGNTGSGTAFSNLQPYITCYMWKRTN